MNEVIRSNYIRVSQITNPLLVIWKVQEIQKRLNGRGFPVFFNL